MKKVIVLLFENICTDGRVKRQLDILSKIDDIEISLFAFNNNDFRYKNFFSLGKERTLLPSYFFFIRKFLFSIKADYIYCNNIQSIIPALLIKILNIKAKIIYDSHELIIPDPETGISIASKKSQFLERIITKLASKVICPNEDRANLMMSSYQLDSKPFIVPNFLESGEWDSGILNEKVGRFTFIYQGVLKNNRYLIELIKAFKFVDNAQLFIVGFGELEENIKTLITELSLMDKVVLVGSLPREKLYKLTKTCHVGIVTYDFSNINNKLCAPNKISEYLLLGLPIISTPQVTIKNIIENESVGLCFNKDALDSEDLINISKTFKQAQKNYNMHLENVLKCRMRFEFKAENYTTILDFSK
ncbi:glycosyltransferase [Photobacterium sp. SP02]|uniref:glycosyltransferase n=1 Tax=Photobacterium sp. SP02 TaxID=3032280 RepID=UPI00314554E6